MTEFNLSVLRIVKLPGRTFLLKPAWHQHQTQTWHHWELSQCISWYLCQEVMRWTFCGVVNKTLCLSYLDSHAGEVETTAIRPAVLMTMTNIIWFLHITWFEVVRRRQTRHVTVQEKSTPHREPTAAVLGPQWHLEEWVHETRQHHLATTCVPDVRQPCMHVYRGCHCLQVAPAVSMCRCRNKHVLQVSSGMSTLTRQRETWRLVTARQTLSRVVVKRTFQAGLVSAGQQPSPDTSHRPSTHLPSSGIT